MKEQQYTFLGWSILILSGATALLWCLSEGGLTGWFITKGQQLLNVRLNQISCLLTIATLCLPAYIVKNYFDALAWKKHVSDLPPPDVYASAKRSKYVQRDQAPPPPQPKPIEITNLPKGQQEFIATCPSCGNFFPAQTNAGDLKCPSCGEAVPLKG
jgi:hypothetical protein